VLVHSLESRATVLRNTHDFTDEAMRGVRKVVIRSCSKELNDLALEGIGALWSTVGIAGVDLARRKNLVTYKVVGEEDL